MQRTLGVPTRAPLPLAHRGATRRTSVTARALPRRELSCPYEVLGLPPNTEDEATVKRAYRKLAKQYHPDVLQAHQQEEVQQQEPSGDAAHAPVQFLSIAEAYSFIMERLRNGTSADGETRPGNSRAFHEWMWEFRLRRTWQRHNAARQQTATTEQHHQQEDDMVAEDASGCTDSGPPSSNAMGMNGGAASAGAHQSTPQSAEGLRSQLAGLRHRAAIRKNRPPTPPASSCSSDNEDEPRSSNPAAHAPVHRAFRANGEALFACASGPSDSADPPPAAVQHVPAAVAAPGDAVQVASGADPAHAPQEQQQQQVPGGQQAAARRRFASNSTVREALKEQLHGMRRKAALRERIYSAAEGASSSMGDAGSNGVA